MKSRERVLRSLDCSLAGRVPRQLWTLPWGQKHHPEKLQRIETDFPNDIAGCPALYSRAPMTLGDAYAVGEYTDEWGCTWVNLQEGVVGEIKDPLIKKWDDIDTLRLPEELLTLDREAVNDYCRRVDTFVLQGTCARPFERLQFLRKTENLYLDLAERSGGLKRLIEKVHGFYLEEMELWATTEIDALFFMDDWGSQQALLISPDMWRQLFKPLYKDYIDLAHAAGKKVFMHSDCYIIDVIPDLIELGLDALNSQLFCMGVENLEQFRGKICFWGEIDRQHLLPHGTEEEIKTAVRDVYQYLYRDGDVIAQCEFGPSVNPDNVYTIFQTWDTLTTIK